MRWSILPYARIVRERCNATVSVGDARFGMQMGRGPLRRVVDIAPRPAGLLGGRHENRLIVLGLRCGQYDVMNVHSNSGGYRRAAAQRAVRRYGDILWAHLPSRPFQPILNRIDAGLLHGSLELHLPTAPSACLAGGSRASPRSSISRAGARLSVWRPPARWAGSRHGRPESGPAPIRSRSLPCSWPMRALLARRRGRGA